MKQETVRESGAPTRYRWLIFGVLAAQFLLVYFHRVSCAVVAPDLAKTFQISGTALGVLSAGYFYTYAWMQLPAGLLVDTWGARRTVTAFTLLAGLGSIFFGLSPGFGMATFARILVGLGVSTVFVGSAKVFLYWFHGREYARVSGIYLAVGGTGWLMAATPLAVLSGSFGWRTVFLAIGGISLFLTVATWLIVRDQPEKEGGPGGDVPVKEKEKGTAARNIRLVLGERYFWPLAIWSFFNGGILFGFLGLWAGPYLMETHVLSKAVTGNILSMVALAMIFGCPFLGYLADRVIRSRKVMLVSSAVIHALCWVVLIVWHKSLPYPSFYPLFFIMALTSCAIPVVLITATKELFPGEISGTGQGLMNLFPFVGSMVFQPVLGFILDRTRTAGGDYVFDNAFYFLFTVSVAGLVSLLFMKGTRQSSLQA